MRTDDFEKMEKDGWGDPAIASGYADGFAHATAVAAQKLADQVGAGQGVKILDLCTGHGVVAQELVARGADVTGLDFSAAMIALAQARVPRATFVEGDAMAMTFEDAQFDAITIGFGVPHFPDPAQGMREAARVLKPGGKVAFSIWRGKGSNGAFDWLFDAVGRLGDPSVTLPPGPDAHHLVTDKAAAPLMADAGFADMQVHDVATDLWVPQPEDLFDIFDQGAVRAASLLGGQSATIRGAIRADLAKRVVAEGRLQQVGSLVPAPSVIVTGTRI